MKAIIVLLSLLIVSTAYFQGCGKDKKYTRVGSPDEDKPEDIPLPQPSPPGFVTFDQAEDYALRYASELNDIDSDNVRFINLTDLFNQKPSKEEIDEARRSIQKAVNSLSFERDIIAAKPVDPDGVILALDLREIGWTSKHWCLIEEADPFKFESFTRRGRLLKVLTRSDRPWIHGSNFLRIALNSNDKFKTYYDIMGIPGNLYEFFDLIGVNLQEQFDEQEQKLYLAGVRNPIISLGKNREVIRFDTREGPGWGTYDFNQDFNDLKNLSRNPFPPEARSKLTFKHDAQEFIVPLPNGFHMYALFNGDGVREDFAPLDVVADNNPGGLDPTIRNAQKCMKCHNDGIIQVTDALGSAIQVNPNIGADDKLKARLFFKTPDGLAAGISSDNNRYQSALAKVGISPGDRDPVNIQINRLDDGLTSSEIAALFYLPEDEFIERLRGSGLAIDEVSTIISGDTLDINKFIDIANVLVAELNLFRDDDLP